MRGDHPENRGDGTRRGGQDPFLHPAPAQAMPILPRFGDSQWQHARRPAPRRRRPTTARRAGIQDDPRSGRSSPHHPATGARTASKAFAFSFLLAAVPAESMAMTPVS